MYIQSQPGQAVDIVAVSKVIHARTFVTHYAVILITPNSPKIERVILRIFIAICKFFRSCLYAAAVQYGISLTVFYWQKTVMFAHAMIGGLVQGARCMPGAWCMILWYEVIHLLA